MELVPLPDKNSFRHCGLILCKSCNEIFYKIHNIFVLLDKELANKKIISDFVTVYKEEITKIYHQYNENDRLFCSVVDNNLDWKKSEIEFWDNRKYKRKVGGSHIKNYNYNRMEVRKKNISSILKSSIKGKVLVEFGGGDGATIFYTLNPSKYQYTYINTDISFNALLLGQDYHPNGIFIQCDATNPPFQKETFDIIVNFGTLHHLPENDKVIENQIDLLKSGGYLALHEPIDRRGAILSRFNLFRKLNPEQSDHNEYIVEKRVLMLFERNGRIINYYVEYSPLRTWLVRLNELTVKFNNKLMHWIFANIDQIVIKTAGKLTDSFKGSSALILFKKEKRSLEKD